MTFEETALQRAGGPSEAAVEGTARALREAASWVGCDTVAVGEVVPPAAAVRLRQALATDG